jgi:hypothetical protein
MRVVSAVSVMGVMASLMNRSGMVGILFGNPHSEKAQMESECLIILRLWNQTSMLFFPFITQHSSGAPDTRGHSRPIRKPKFSRGQPIDRSDRN